MMPEFRTMRRSKTHSIGEVIRSYLEDNGLDHKLKEVNLIESWEEIVGKMISNRKKNDRIIILLGLTRAINPANKPINSSPLRFCFLCHCMVSQINTLKSAKL